MAGMDGAAPTSDGRSTAGAHLLLAWATIVANTLFVITFLVAAAWQGRRYSTLEHSISDMYAIGAPHAVVLIVVLTVAGAVTVAFCAFALWPVVRSTGWSGRLGTVALGLSIFGLGDLLTPFERLGCRLADPGCTPDAQTATLGGTLDVALSAPSPAPPSAGSPSDSSRSPARPPSWASR